MSALNFRVFVLLLLLIAKVASIDHSRRNSSIKGHPETFVRQVKIPNQPSQHQVKAPNQPSQHQQKAPSQVNAPSQPSQHFVQKLFHQIRRKFNSKPDSRIPKDLRKEAAEPPMRLQPHVLLPFEPSRGVVPNINASEAYEIIMSDTLNTTPMHPAKVIYTIFGK